jgi:hypothetical protein
VTRGGQDPLVVKGLLSACAAGRTRARCMKLFFAAPESFLPSALTAFSSHASRLHFFRKLLSARIVLADVVIPSAFPVTFGPHVQPARDPLQVSAFLKPAARASSSEQNQRFGFFSVR